MRRSVIAACFFCAQIGWGATFTVTNPNDTGPESLRQAILSSNTSVPPNNIHFNIAGAGPHLIAPLTPLPQITTSVDIDGTTEPGFAGVPLIQLNRRGIV